MTRTGLPGWGEHLEHTAVVGADSWSADTAAGIVAAVKGFVGTAADMAVAATVGEEIVQTEVSVVHEVLGTEDRIAVHMKVRTLVAPVAVAAHEVGRHISSQLGDLVSDV